MVQALDRRGHTALGGLVSPKPRKSLQRQRFRRCVALAWPSGVCLRLATALDQPGTAVRWLPFFFIRPGSPCSFTARACTGGRVCG